VRWPPSPPSCPVARAQLQHTCAAHPAEVQVWHGAPLLRAAGCFQCVSGVSTFLGILVRTRNCNGSQCADPRAHKETAMVRNQLTPKCNRSNRCSFTKPPPQVGVSRDNCWILCQYGFSIGMPNFVLPNLDSVNHCTSKEISMEIKRYLLVQWLTESRFGKTKFGFPIEIRSLSLRCFLL